MVVVVWARQCKLDAIINLNVPASNQTCVRTKKTSTITTTMETSRTLPNKRQSIDNSMINTRFPKLDENAHFHYEFSELAPNFNASLIVNNHRFDGSVSPSNAVNVSNIENLNFFIRIRSGDVSWIIRRNLKDFFFFDAQLHKCVFDRQHSKLNALSLANLSTLDSFDSIVQLIGDYLTRFSQVVGSFITCGQLLHWLEVDNRGKHFPIQSESDINTPAIGAAFSIKQHIKNNMEEISFDVGDIISVIEMPETECFYWKGKKGLEVGYFPAECVKLLNQSTDFALRPLKLSQPRKRHSDLFGLMEENKENMGHVRCNSTGHNSHNMISDFFRTFAYNRHPRRKQDKIKRSGKLRERIFGCDLSEHLTNSDHNLPLVLIACTSYIEKHGLEMNGIYRLSGVGSTIQKLRSAFDEGRLPEEMTESSGETVDVHNISSVLKLYFRELPNPLLTFSLYNSFIEAMRATNISPHERLHNIRLLIMSLPPPNWRTLRYLIRHLNYVSKFASKTGMTIKNLAIVWAPNLLRSRDLDLVVNVEALQLISTQAVLAEFLIVNCDKIFDREECEIHPPKLYFPDESQFDNSRMKFKTVGPQIVPGKYHTVIDYPPPNPKRSKSVLFNLRKLHFFASRPSSIQCRSNLFDKTNGSGLFKKNSSSFNENGDYLLSSDSLEDTQNFDKKEYIKRSQSLDSYFKKLKTSSSKGDDNNNFSSQIENDNNKLKEKQLDLNRNEYNIQGVRNTGMILEVNECIYGEETGMEFLDNYKNEAKSIHEFSQPPEVISGNNLELNHSVGLRPSSSTPPALSSSETKACTSSTSILTPMCNVNHIPIVRIAECEIDQIDSSQLSSPEQTIAFIDENSTTSPAHKISSSSKQMKNQTFSSGPNKAKLSTSQTSQVREAMYAGNNPQTSVAQDHKGPSQITTLRSNGSAKSRRPVSLLATSQIMEREKIEKIKEERRIYMRPVVLRHSPIDKSPKKESSLSNKIESRKTSFVMPSISNSKRVNESSPVKMRTKITNTSRNICSELNSNQIGQDLIKSEISPKRNSSIEVKSKLSSTVSAKIDYRVPSPKQSPDRTNLQVKYRYPLNSDTKHEPNNSTASSSYTDETNTSSKTKSGNIEYAPLRRINRRQRIIDSTAIVQQLESQAKMKL